MKCKGIVLALACVLVILCGCSKPDKEGAKIKTGQEALPLPVFFEGQDTKGNEVTSAVFSESKLTMVNVWATFCSPCLNEMPDLGELAQEYEKKDFQIIGVVSDVMEGDDQEKLDLVTGLIDKTGADYPHLLLNESLYNAFGKDAAAVPTTFFLNEKGMLLDTVVGANELNFWKELVDGFLDDMNS